MSYYKYIKNNIYFKKARSQAYKYVQDPSKLKSLLTKVFKKADNLNISESSMNRFVSQLKTLGRMLNEYIKGNYPSMPWKSVLLIVAGLLYFVMPMDIVPDMIPLSGFIDDATIIFWIIQNLQKDIEHFMEWEQTFATELNDQKN